MTRKQHNNDTNRDFFAALEGRVLMSAEGAPIVDAPQPEPGFTGGVFVAAGDVDGDGVVTGPGAGGGPNVKGFFAYDQGFTGGVRVAAGDVTGDGTPDIITGAGPGGGPHVKVVDGGTSQATDDVWVDGNIITAENYDSAVADAGNTQADSFTGGVRVAVGDVNNDHTPDIVVAAGPGGGPHVMAQPYDTSFMGGVFVASADVSGDGVDDVITGAGPNSAADGKEWTDTKPMGWDNTANAPSELNLANTPQEPEMLLPAVQKVREAVDRAGMHDNPDQLGVGEQEPEMLLPAVQKVREAAAKSECTNNLKQMTMFEEHSNTDALRLVEAENDTADTGLEGQQCLVFFLGGVQ